MRDPLQAGMPKKGKMLALAGSRRGGKLEICRNLIVLGKKTDKMLGTEYIGQHFMYLKRTWTGEWGLHLLTLNMAPSTTRLGSSLALSA